eukprot:Clim_evm36s77 gene=Clim_evmTU36s77
MSNTTFLDMVRAHWSLDPPFRGPKSLEQYPMYPHHSVVTGSPTIRLAEDFIVESIGHSNNTHIGSRKTALFVELEASSVAPYSHILGFQDDGLCSSPVLYIDCKQYKLRIVQKERDDEMYTFEVINRDGEGYRFHTHNELTQRKWILALSSYMAFKDEFISLERVLEEPPSYDDMEVDSSAIMLKQFLKLAIKDKRKDGKAYEILKAMWPSFAFANDMITTIVAEYGDEKSHTNREACADLLICIIQDFDHSLRPDVRALVESLTYYASDEGDFIMSFEDVDVKEFLLPEHLRRVHAVLEAKDKEKTVVTEKGAKVKFVTAAEPVQPHREFLSIPPDRLTTTMKPRQVAEKLTYAFLALWRRVDIEMYILYPSNEHSCVNDLQTAAQDLMNYVKHSIVERHTSIQREVTVTFWIHTAEFLVKYGNYECAVNTMIAVSHALVLMHQCKEVTQHPIDSLAMELFGEDANYEHEYTIDFEHYRQRLDREPCPIIPYWGTLKSDIVNLQSLPIRFHRGGINFDRAIALYSIIRQVNRWQGEQQAQKPT